MMRAMRARAALAVVAVVAAGLLISPARAAPAAVVLAGATVVSGSVPSMVRVVIPAPAHLSLADVDNPDIAIEGEGRIIGFLLTSDDRPGAGNGLYVRRLAPPADCTTCPRSATPFVMDLANRWTGDLAPGVYRFYLLTDGSPVTVRLTLHGLTGSVALRPHVPVALETHELTPRVDFVPGDSVWTSGAYGVLRSQGLILGDLTVPERFHVVGMWGVCFRPGYPPRRGFPSAAACPFLYGADGFQFQGGGLTVSKTHMGMVFALELSPDQWALGAQYATASIAHNPAAAAIWLSLD